MNAAQFDPRATADAAWNEQRAIRDVMVFLQAHGASVHLAARIFKRADSWKATIDLVRALVLATTAAGSLVESARATTSCTRCTSPSFGS